MKMDIDVFINKSIKGSALFILFCLLVIFKSVIIAHAQEPVIDRFNLLESKINKTIPAFGFRVEISRIAPDLFIDQPTNEGFEKVATVVLKLNGAYFQDRILNIINMSKSEKWIPVDYKGYARWRLGFIGPSADYDFSLYIDDDSNLICFNDHWYKTSKDYIRYITRDLAQAAVTLNKSP